MQYEQSLNSSWLSSAAYDDETRELQITTVAGRTYTHHEVPKEVYDGLVSSRSPGQYWNERIKGVYQ